MDLHSFLRDIVVTFGFALGIIAASRLLRIPAVVALLFTGCVVGPYGAALIRNPAHVELFAELGVVFLLFEIGLELSLRRLRNLGRSFFLGGSVQASSTIAVAAVVAWLFSYTSQQSIFLGLVLSLSSTAIVLQLYKERREMGAPQGPIALGILIFQDILIVPYMLIVPLLGGSAEASPVQFLFRFFIGVTIMVVVFTVSRFLVPSALHYLASVRIRELFVIGALFLCLGAALAAQKLGFSLALGAFLVGVLIAESEYRHQVIAETQPFRDVFTSMFFISVGMLLKLDVVASQMLTVAVVTLLIIAVKGIALYLTVRAIKFPSRIAATVALGLSQIGEFSFVLLQAGKGYGVIDEQTYQFVIAASILTMALTPLLMRVAPVVAEKLGRLPAGDAPVSESSPGNHVIIVGFGLAGQHLARVLKAAAIPYAIVELNGNTVKRAKKQGEPIIYGDASRESILNQCNIQAAVAIVFVISDPIALKRGVRAARQLRQDILIIVRTRMQAEIEELRKCGADEVVSEEFETSIEIFTNVLMRLRIPGNIIKTQTRLLRQNDYTMLRSQSQTMGLSEGIMQALKVGTTDTFLITTDSGIAGKSIKELDLRKITGATIIALIRNDKPITNPSPETRIASGDLLVLVGSHAQMDEAFGYLEGSNSHG